MTGKHAPKHSAENVRARNEETLRRNAAFSFDEPTAQEDEDTEEFSTGVIETAGDSAQNSDSSDVDVSAKSVGSSALLISGCVIVSRITGFLRTLAMAFALGSTALSSAYQVANNLPNMLYEMAVGGIIVTAFLPVYVSTKKKLGAKGANDYASNLISLTILFAGGISILCIIFSAQLIYTQSFLSDQSDMETSVFFFRFFAIQILFYGLSAISSGILNAERDYLWSSLAPVFNNLIVIATFLMYAFISPTNPALALLIIAIGNPLGVFVQMAVQIPAFKRNGIKIRFRVNIHDPAIRETLSIGVPAIIVMVGSYIIVSVQNAIGYTAADNGPSVIAYARLWYTLPYAFLTVPITTAMFTELSHMKAERNKKGFIEGVTGGTCQIIFFMIPMMLFLIVFSRELATIYHTGAFTEDAIAQVAFYLAVLATSLPFYAVGTYLQKTFSALRMVKQYAIMDIICIVVQIAFTYIFGVLVLAGSPYALGAVAFGETVFFVLLDTSSFIFLHRKLGKLGLRRVAVTTVRSLALGALGAFVGATILYLLGAYVGPMGTSILRALTYTIIAGIPAVCVTYGIAVKKRLPEAQFVTNSVDRLVNKIRRR